MKVGDRLTLLVDDERIVRTSPYTLAAALHHVAQLEPQVAERLELVVVEVLGVREAIERAERDTLPAPAPAAEDITGAPC
jgi:hypothetical protein